MPPNKKLASLRQFYLGHNAKFKSLRCSKIPAKARVPCSIQAARGFDSRLQYGRWFKTGSLCVMVWKLNFQRFSVLKCEYIGTPGLGSGVEFSWRFVKL